MDRQYRRYGELLCTRLLPKVFIENDVGNQSILKNSSILSAYFISNNPFHVFFIRLIVDYCVKGKEINVWIHEKDNQATCGYKRINNKVKEFLDEHIKKISAVSFETVICHYPNKNQYLKSNKNGFSKSWNSTNSQQIICIVGKTSVL